MNQLEKELNELADLQRNYLQSSDYMSDYVPLFAERVTDQDKSRYVDELFKWMDGNDKDDVSDREWIEESVIEALENLPSDITLTTTYEGMYLIEGELVSFPLGEHEEKVSEDMLKQIRQNPKAVNSTDWVWNGGEFLYLPLHQDRIVLSMPVKDMYEFIVNKWNQL